jgi:GNAT superfamily N-acetyltransferase
MKTRRHGPSISPAREGYLARRVHQSGGEQPHAEAFQTRVFETSEWDRRTQVDAHSLGWVTARNGGELVGFVNVLWYGLVHAWIQDVMVSESARHQGVRKEVVAAAAQGAREAGASGCTSTSTTTCGPSTSMPAASSRRTPASWNCDRPLFTRRSRSPSR